MSRNSPIGVSSLARPVPEVPVEVMLARVDELARRWVVALILAHPLKRIGELPLDRVAQDAPELFGLVIQALGSDGGLERIAEGGREGSVAPRWLGLLADTPDAPSAVEAVEALRGVVWEALIQELSDPPARRVAELADRLAHVCASALVAALARGSSAEGPIVVEEGDLAAPGSSRAMGGADISPVGPSGSVLIDEREEMALDSGRDIGEPPPEPPPARRPQEEPPLPWESPSAQPGEPRPTPEVRIRAASEDTVAPEDRTELEYEADAAVDSPRIEIRDERGEEGPAAWIRSIGRRLERYEHDRLPFAVLLVELGGVERLRRAALPGGISSLTSQVERVLAQELHLDGAASTEGRGWPTGSLTRERPGRYWLLVEETDAIAARRLAEWLVRAIRPLAARRWPPLEVTVGTAVCPGDGHDAAALAARADMGLYAARTAGRSVASVDEQP